MPLYANVIKVWPLTCDLCIKSCLDCPTHSPFQTTSFMNDPWDIHVLRYKRVLKIGISSVHHLTNEVYVVAISAHMQGCVIRIILLRYASLLYMEGRISNLRQRENAFSFINCKLGRKCVAKLTLIDRKEQFIDKWSKYEMQTNLSN